MHQFPQRFSMYKVVWSTCRPILGSKIIIIIIDPFLSLNDQMQ